MTERPGLSKSELAIARTLWELKSASVREVYEAVSAEKDIDFSTVQTYLRRLEKKGYAKAVMNGRLRIYSPRIKPNTVIRETVNDLIDRLFGGETMPLMRHLIENRKVSADEVSQLKSLIDRLEEDAS